jgi:hypothetical protein
MDLTSLENDLLGDLRGDDHSLYEVFGFVRHHHPGSDDREVFCIGRELVATWIGRGWLALAGSGAQWAGLRSVDELVPSLDRLDVEATRYFVGSPWVTLAPKALSDVDWLRPVVDA